MILKNTLCKHRVKIKVSKSDPFYICKDCNEILTIISDPDKNLEVMLSLFKEIELELYKLGNSSLVNPNEVAYCFDIVRNIKRGLLDVGVGNTKWEEEKFNKKIEDLKINIKWIEEKLD